MTQLATNPYRNLTPTILEKPYLPIVISKVPLVTAKFVLSEIVAEIKKYNWLINENFTLACDHNLFKIESLVKDKDKNGFFLTYLNQTKKFKQMKLTFDARRIQDTPNAGGSSVESETLSFELFKKYFNATLLKTEMEVSYFPEGGSITDYVINLFGCSVGVSVTRAMKHDNTELRSMMQISY